MNAKIVAAIVLLGLAVGFGITSFKQSMTPYVSFAEARRAHGLVQVNGTLADKNYVLKKQDQFLEFKLRDGHGQVMDVAYHGVIPGNFDQATAVVAIGRWTNQRFEADQLLVKCPSKYQTAPERTTTS